MISRKRTARRTPAAIVSTLWAILPAIALGLPSARAAGTTAAPAAAAATASSVVRLRRFALFVGVNDGGPSRQRLRYAVSDARAMARVLASMGGVTEGDALFLENPDRTALLGAFDRMAVLLRDGSTPGVRRELLLYYSGHSDEEGLLIQGQRVSYGDLRARLQTLPVEVRVAVLDSCSSGAFTRRKGGVHHAPFLVDASADMRGQAILTSSSANEVAQESDRIGGSFFTHFLVSGLRGAADVNRDRRVTLQEAFQFASQETLARTERTRGGPQHAAYEFDLAGTGELVVTDVRSTQAALVLASELAGRISVRDTGGALVAELRKGAGHPVELGLEPGAYVVTMDGAGSLFEARATLAAGERTQLARLAFHATGPLEVAVARGDGDAQGASPAVPAAAVAAVAAPPQAHARVPVHLALANVDPQSVDVHGLALGVVATRVARVHGFEMAFGLAQTDEVMSGVQLALGGAIARGYTSGAQFGGFAGMAEGSFRGLQIASLVTTMKGDARGAQISGILGYSSGTFSGLQIAPATIAESISGAQIGAAIGANAVRGLQLGALAVAGDIRGMQVSAVNVSRRMTGFQLGAVNVTSEATGLQIAAVNVTRRARGFTLGAVNVVDEHEGEALGVLTFARNGIHNVAVYSTDSMAANIELKLGTRHLYTSIGAAFHPGDELAAETGPDRYSRGTRRMGFGLGLGWRFRLEAGRLEALELEAHSTDIRPGFDQTASGPMLSALRLLGVYRLAPHLAVIGGPTMNVAVAWEGRDLEVGPGILEQVYREGGTTVRIYPGLLLGLQI